MSEGHGPNHYFKVYGWLVALLIVSVIGPMAGIEWLTLVTAFGIAIVKAALVVINFMHLTIEKKYISYIVGTCLVFMFLFFSATAPDIMNDRGSNWIKKQDMLHIPIESGHHEGGHSEGEGAREGAH